MIFRYAHFFIGLYRTRTPNKDRTVNHHSFSIGFHFGISPCAHYGSFPQIGLFPVIQILEIFDLTETSGAMGLPWGLQSSEEGGNGDCSDQARGLRAGRGELSLTAAERGAAAICEASHPPDAKSNAEVSINGTHLGESMEV